MSVSELLKKHKVTVGVVGTTLVVGSVFGTCTFAPDLQVALPTEEVAEEEAAPEEEAAEEATEEAAPADEEPALEVVGETEEPEEEAPASEEEPTEVEE